MVVNFKTCGISRDARKLARTPTLNLKKKEKKMVLSRIKQHKQILIPWRLSKSYKKREKCHSGPVLIILKMLQTCHLQFSKFAACT
jgi:hypothetical protein